MVEKTLEQSEITVSIPLRQAKNGNDQGGINIISCEFQFLLGRLKTQQMCECLRELKEGFNSS